MKQYDVLAIFGISVIFSAILQLSIDEVVEENGIPGENHHFNQVTGNFLICPSWDSNPGSDERRLAVRNIMKGT